MMLAQRWQSPEYLNEDERVMVRRASIALFVNTKVFYDWRKLLSKKLKLMGSWAVRFESILQQTMLKEITNEDQQVKARQVYDAVVPDRGKQMSHLIQVPDVIVASGASTGKFEALNCDGA